jgi:hypothetical protein
VVEVSVLPVEPLAVVLEPSAVKVVLSVVVVVELEEADEVAELVELLVVLVEPSEVVIELSVVVLAELSVLVIMVSEELAVVAVSEEAASPEGDSKFEP